ncbi:glycosyltransferase family 4 protein [Candidatus Poribacteria bacterium]|nr:glycosyltransferase family 4 protein [Candidatus Poribacteria bacterium]
MTSRRRPIRFLFLNYEFPPLGGGSGTGSKFLAKELVLLGHEVEVVTSWFPGLPREFRWRTLRLRRIRTLRKMAGQCRPHEMISYVLSAFFHLLLRRAPKPDVIVSFHSIPSGMPALPLSILWRVPHIVLFRGGDVPGFLPQDLARLHAMTLWLNRWIVYQARGAMANSKGLAELAAKAFPRKHIGVLANGVDARIFTPPTGRRAGGPLTLLFAGRMTNQKGLDTLIAALKRVRQLAPDCDWRMVMVGDGPVKDSIQRMAEVADIAGRVVFTGWLDRKQMLGQYRRADLLVFPSRYEGMPNVVLEAMSCGLPVIGTHIAGTEELVADGANGFLVNVDDVEALADRILLLADDEQLRQRMGSRGRAAVLENWSWTRRAKELEAVARAVGRG